MSHHWDSSDAMKAALLGFLQAGRQGEQCIVPAKPTHSDASHSLCFPAILRPILGEQNRNRKFIAGQKTAQYQPSLTPVTGEPKTWRCPAPQEKSSEGWCSQASLPAAQPSINPGLFTQGICTFWGRNMEWVSVAR